MMGSIREILASFSRLFQWWVVVAPWEQALRIRGGKRSTLLLPGVHFRIPFWDRIYRQSIRLRAYGVPTQTVGTKDGFVVSLRLVLMYQIDNLERVYDSIENLDTLAAMAASGAAGYIATHDLADIKAPDIEQVASDNLDLTKYGMKGNGDSSVKVVEMACVKKTYRLITGDMSSEGYWSSINLRDHIDDRD